MAERRQMIDDFMAEVIEDWDPSHNFAPRWSGAADLPDDPSPEQIDAWVELAELVSDPDFRHRVRQVTDFGRSRDGDERLRMQGNWVTENAVSAALRGCPPDSAEAAQVVNRILEYPGGSLRREELLAALELVTDRRIDRYAELTAIINGWPPFPSYTPAMEWLIAALRAHQ